MNNTSLNIEQQANYPWQGKVLLSVHSEKAIQFTIKFRIPGWVNNQVIPGNLYNFIKQTNTPVKIKINGKETEYYNSKGYACINRKWNNNDTVELILPMEIKHIAANKMVSADSNMSALEYGPLVYCFEGLDNNSLDKFTMPDDANLKIERKDNLLGGINEIVGEVPAINGKGKLKITGIPYYAWSNRGEGPMKVWLPRK